MFKVTKCDFEHYIYLWSLRKILNGATLFRRKREVAFRYNSLYNNYKRRSLRMRKYVIAQ